MQRSPLCWHVFLHDSEYEYIWPGTGTEAACHHHNSHSHRLLGTISNPSPHDQAYPKAPQWVNSQQKGMSVIRKRVIIDEAPSQRSSVGSLGQKLYYAWVIGVTNKAGTATQRSDHAVYPFSKRLMV